MNAPDQLSGPRAIQRAQALADQFALTAAVRDKQGGNPKFERDLIRGSGLLSLSIPRIYAGQGADWATVFKTIQVIAQADSSLAHVYGFHHLLIATVQLFAQAEQYADWLQRTATEQLFWGNSLNPLDRRVRVEQRTEQDYIFHGEKSFSSGSIDADLLLCSGYDAEDKLLIAVIPSDRQGLHFLGDWDNMGQRQTDSGSTRFDQVRVARHELLLDPGPLSTPYSSLRPLIAQLIFVHLFLGVAEGAFAVAQQSVQQQKAWSSALVQRAVDDPYIQKHFAEFYLQLQSVRLLSAQAVQALSEAWQQGPSLSAEQRGQVSVQIATAKIAATQASLYISQNIFQVMGARATTAQLNLDRFWRNVRTQTLHDPVDYKYQELGAWLLTGRVPKPSFYG